MATSAWPGRGPQRRGSPRGPGRAAGRLRALGQAVDRYVRHDIGVASLTLTLGRQTIHTVFDLLGTQENDLTSSLGWGMVNSPILLQAIATEAGIDNHGDVLAVSLQEPAVSGGFTDVEVDFERHHLIIEAKRGWALPHVTQLTKYCKRFEVGRESVLLVVSEADREYATRRLPPNLEGVPVRYLSWADLIRLAGKCAGHAGSHSEQRILRELGRYLRGAVRMQDPFSTWTYSVSVSHKTPPGWGLSFRDIVDRGYYFHPFGISGWPRTAPAFLALRWANAVQRIHHVDQYKVVDSIHQHFPEIPADELTGRPHLLYTLGPKLGPTSPLPAGTTYRASRLWVALDLLLTSTTLKEALATTRVRQGKGGGIEPV